MLKDITKALREHLSPAPIFIGEQFKFYQRRQGQGESIGDNMRELKRLIETCEFENVTDPRADALRDFFIIGLNDKHAQQRLLRDRTVTLESALELAISNELSIQWQLVMSLRIKVTEQYIR